MVCTASFHCENREKERQICKIEEEKHRVREKELGKNYLLETYFKGLDEAQQTVEMAADEHDAFEIFIGKHVNAYKFWEI